MNRDLSSADAATHLRVTLVAYHYPPDPAVGSLRARNVAQAFAAAGHEVVVISVARPEAPKDARDGRVRVLRVVPGLAPRDVLAKLKRTLSRKSAAPLGGRGDEKQEAKSGAAWKSPDRVSRLRRWVSAITWLPDDRQGFILPAAKAAAAIMRGDGKDLLYTTAPPFSDHLVGLIARRRKRCRWIVEYRDPWTDSSHKPWFVRTKLTDWIEERIERRCLLTSDGVVPVSMVFSEVLTRRCGPMLAKKMIVVRNGIPDVAKPRLADPNRFRIVYAGSFYLRRDPLPFLNALAAIRRCGGPRQLDVQLVGDCRFFEGLPLAPEVERLGLSDIVTFVDWLPHDQSVAMMQSADLLLLLAQDQPLSIPNKAYEYLGTGKPILAVVDRDGETARVLKEVGGHIVLSGDDPPDAMQRALTAALGAPFADRDSRLSLKTLSQMNNLTAWVERTQIQDSSPKGTP